MAACRQRGHDGELTPPGTVLDNDSMLGECLRWWNADAICCFFSSTMLPGISASVVMRTFGVGKHSPWKKLYWQFSRRYFRAALESGTWIFQVLVLVLVLVSVLASVLVSSFCLCPSFELNIHVSIEKIPFRAICLRVESPLWRGILTLVILVRFVEPVRSECNDDEE